MKTPCQQLEIRQKRKEKKKMETNFNCESSWFGNMNNCKSFGFVLFSGLELAFSK